MEKDYTVKAVVCDHNIPSVSYSLEFHQEIKVRKERLAAAGWPPGAWLGRLKLCVCTGGLDNSKRYERDPQVVYDELLAAAGTVRILGQFRSNYRK